MTNEDDRLTKFKASLEDVLVVTEKLAPICEKTSHLVEMLRLALENDGQLKLIIAMVTPKK